MTARPYRPEGDALWAFEARWCDRCHRGPIDVVVCPIWAAAMAYLPGASNFPPEWTADLDGPRCSAFAEREGMPAESIFTIDLFGKVF